MGNSRVVGALVPVTLLLAACSAGGSEEIEQSSSKLCTDPKKPTKPAKTRICHYPGKGAPHVIEVAAAALPAHLAHGDGLAPPSITSNADCNVPHGPAAPVTSAGVSDFNGVAQFVISDTNIRVLATVVDEAGMALSGVDVTLLAVETDYMVVAQQPAENPRYTPAFIEGSLLDARPGSAPTLPVKLVMKLLSATLPFVSVFQQGGSIPNFVASHFYRSSDRCLSKEAFRDVYRWQCELVWAATNTAASAAGSALPVVPAATAGQALSNLFSLVGGATTLVSFACRTPGPFCDFAIEAATMVGFDAGIASLAVAPSGGGLVSFLVGAATTVPSAQCGAAANLAAEAIYGDVPFKRIRQYTTPLLGPGVATVPLYFEEVGACGGACCDPAASNGCVDVASAPDCAVASSNAFHDGTFCSAQPCGQRNITVVAGGRGIISILPTGVQCFDSACSATVESGSTVTIIASPVCNSRFVSWSGDCSGEAAGFSRDVDSDLTCSASFITDPFPVVVADSITCHVQSMVPEGSGTRYTYTLAGSGTATFPPGSCLRVGIGDEFCQSGGWSVSQARSQYVGPFGGFAPMLTWTVDQVEDCIGDPTLWRDGSGPFNGCTL